MSYQVIQNRQLLPLQWQLHAYYPLASCVCPKGIGTQMNVISLNLLSLCNIVLTRSLETAVVISAYGPLMNKPHKPVKTK